MSISHTESIIWSIIREISRECSVQKIAVPDTLAAFMVKAVLQNPDYELNIERPLTKGDILKLVEICVQKLTQRDSPAMETVKMQVYFDMNYASRKEFVLERRNNQKEQLAPHIQEIIDSRVSTKGQITALYEKLIHVALLSSGLGSPTDPTVLREMSSAMESVYPLTEIGKFMSLSRKEKEVQIQELTEIVMGIRLFNRYSKRDWAKGTVEDLPTVLDVSLKSAEKKLQEDLEHTLARVYKYTGILEKYYLQKSIIPPEVLQVKDALCNTHQHVAFLKVLVNDVKISKGKVTSLQGQLQQRLVGLQDTIQARCAVPTMQVFPQFIHLSQIWMGLQDELFILNMVTGLSQTMHEFVHVLDNLDNQKIAPLLEEVVELTDAQRLTATDDLSVNPDGLKCEVYNASNARDFDKLPLQYAGFCSWVLVNGDGMLLPANPNIGVLHWNNLYYAFSSPEAAREFGRNPELFITRVSEVVLRRPELIQILQLQGHFAASQGLRKLPKPARTVIKCDAGIQTELHPVPSNIVKNYQWNEWELRRQAVQLANLCKRSTHSTQTTVSHMRQETSTQVWLPREASVQTKRDAATEASQLRTYFAGLRGSKTTPYRVDLTKPITQD